MLSKIEEKREMECPYLEKTRVELCGASVRALARVEPDEQAYCSTEEHYRCPTLLGHLLRAGARERHNRLRN